MNYLLLLMALIIVGLKPFASVDGDNSKINNRDRSAAALTADQQSDNDSDVAITRHIRKNIMNEKNMSTYAQNIKIITINGMVTLKGPVRSQSEQLRILETASTVAGSTNVSNQMTVVPNKN